MALCCFGWSPRSLSLLGLCFALACSAATETYPEARRGGEPPVRLARPAVRSSPMQVEGGGGSAPRNALTVARPTSVDFVPEPPPSPPLFAGQDTVTYENFIEELRRVADDLAQAPEVQKSYRALLDGHQLTSEDVSLESYSRVRLIFEATRDGGLWGVRWEITDRMPWSDAIWQQWRERDWTGEIPEVTAVAECDELSALFSFLARDVGIEGFAGIFWPTWNHAVAVWQLERKVNRAGQASFVRILVPTSQVWLSREASLGTREFKTNRVVFPYQRKDLKPQTELPAPLARHLIEQLARYGSLSNEEMLERRNRLGGS